MSSLSSRPLTVQQSPGPQCASGKRSWEERLSRSHGLRPSSGPENRVGRKRRADATSRGVRTRARRSNDSFDVQSRSQSGWAVQVAFSALRPDRPKSVGQETPTNQDCDRIWIAHRVVSRTNRLSPERTGFRRRKCCAGSIPAFSTFPPVHFCALSDRTCAQALSRH
jgi:hypothetical protein